MNGTRRPTADIDLLASAISNDTDAVAAVVQEILRVQADDGVEYQPELLTARVSRDAELNAGVRLAVPARLDRARAMKLVTMIDRAEATTRKRDFADVVLLTQRHRVAASELLAALQATARHRRSNLQPLAGLAGRLGPARQPSWSAYLDRNRFSRLLPADYTEAITMVAAFTDPVITGKGRNGGRRRPGRPRCVVRRRTPAARTLSSTAGRNHRHSRSRLRECPGSRAAGAC